MKKTVHNLKRDAYSACETCHTDPIRMGINTPKLKPVNTYLISQAGVPHAYINKDDHYKKLKVPSQTQCTDCHSAQGSSQAARFHQAMKVLEK